MKQRREFNRVANQLIDVAKEFAEDNGLTFEVMNTDGQFFQIQWIVDGVLRWSVSLWPTINEWSRVSWDPEHMGPVLSLPRPWTILDAVDAMVEAKNVPGALDVDYRRLPKMRKR